MVIKNRYVLVLWTKVASELEGLSLNMEKVMIFKIPKIHTVRPVYTACVKVLYNRRAGPALSIYICDCCDEGRFSRSQER